MEKSARKRHTTDSSSDVPHTKKRKKAKKQYDKPSSQESMTDKLSSQETMFIPLIPTPSPEKAHTSPLKAQISSPKKQKLSSQLQEPSQAVASTNSERGGPTKAVKRKKKVNEKTSKDATIEQTEAKPKRRNRAHYLKPTHGSWSKHVGSLLMYRCVSHALMMEVDPREHETETNWNLMVSGFISAKDIELIWYLIKREFPGKSLNAIREELKPYITITPDELSRAEVREQFKDEFPKAPPTAYMLFHRRKVPSLKAKYPNHNMKDVAKILGEKWRTLGEEKQEYYRQQYQELKKDYDAKVAAFYTEHPDAKVPKIIRNRKNDDSLSPEERRIKELKGLIPKSPHTPFVMFSRAKRAKVQKQHPGLSSKDINQKISRKWKTMSDTEKAKYKEMHEEAKKHYKQQLKLFYETYPDALELLSSNKSGTDSAEISTQTSFQTASSKHSNKQDDETDYSTSLDDEDEVGVVSSRGGVVNDDDKADIKKEEISDDEQSASSHEQSHDSTTLSSDDDDSDSD